MFSFILTLGFGLAVGIRHGIDLDHIAAITDITGSQNKDSFALKLAILYAFGHGIAVIALGLIVLVIGQTLPDSLDTVFGKIVGITLILLGIYVLFSIVRDGISFKLKSRWMLIFDLLYHHPKIKEEKYSPASAFGVGMIHGIGAETPTQIGAFLVLLGVDGGVKAILFLLSFVLGIFTSNLVVAALSIRGYKNARKNKNIYLAMGLITAIFSIALGIVFLG